MSENSQVANDVANGIIAEAFESRASDIHFECFEKEACVRVRIDGILKKVKTMSHEEHGAVCTAIKAMAGIDVDETRIPQDGRLQYRTETDTDLRVSTLPSISALGEFVMLV